MSSGKEFLSREEFLELARAYAGLPGTCLFYSGGSSDASRRSFLCLFPLEKLAAPEVDPWSLRLPAIGHKMGGAYPLWTGYFSYEMGAFSDLDRSTSHTHSDLPFAVFYRPSIVIEVDHRTGRASVHGKKKVSLDSLKKSMPSSRKSTFLRLVQQGEDKQFYLDKVLQAQELIRQGEIYQVNLSQEFIYEGRADPFDLFESVARVNPAPFMAYMRLEGSAFICSSPERLLRKEGACLETRPIKGTSKRGRTFKEDRLRKRGLLGSEKEKAELLMITDLMRNDLGRVSVPGSVEVEKIWHLESYANVHHLLSIIRSVARPDLKPMEILRACFPGGSITGCPKLRAMEAIHQFEQRPRGIYTGAIGYFAENGDFDFNIAIRTLMWKENRISIQLGGAIVADSVPEREYEETLHKGESLFHALGAARSGILTR